jgi:hypothetical protein
MFGGRRALRILWFSGIILTITGLAIASWSLQPAGAGTEISAGVSDRKYEPGESSYRRVFTYFLDNTTVTVTAALDPSMSYNFSINKIDGNWNFSRSGAGHEVFSFKPPERGVYEYVEVLNASETASRNQSGTLLWTVETHGNRQTYLLPSIIFLIIPGLTLTLILIITGAAKHVW